MREITIKQNTIFSEDIRNALYAGRTQSESGPGQAARQNRRIKESRCRSKMSNMVARLVLVGLPFAERRPRFASQPGRHHQTGVISIGSPSPHPYLRSAIAATSSQRLLSA